MKQMLLMLNHPLTEIQHTDARANWGVTGFVSMPEDEARLWGQVPPEIGSIKTYAQPIVQWIRENSQAGDLALIQGEFGLVFATVTACLEMGLHPVYATTRRETTERPQADGSIRVERVFKHVQFKHYETL